MKVQILSPKNEVFAGEAKSVFLPGDMSEFEILDHHAPIISLLKGGDVIIDWEKKIPITRGIVKFDKDECIILIED